MYHNRWTPNGRKIEDRDSKIVMYLVITSLRSMVMETGYHLCQLQSAQVPADESYSRSVELYRQAVEILRTFDINAEEFICGSYQPSGVTTL